MTSAPLDEEPLFEEAGDARDEGHSVHRRDAADKLIALRDLLPLGSHHPNRRQFAGRGLRRSLSRQQGEHERQREAGSDWHLTSAKIPSNTATIGGFTRVASHKLQGFDQEIGHSLSHVGTSRAALSCPRPRAPRWKAPTQALSTIISQASRPFPCSTALAL